MARRDGRLGLVFIVSQRVEWTDTPDSGSSVACIKKRRLRWAEAWLILQGDDGQGISRLRRLSRRVVPLPAKLLAISPSL